MFKDQGPNQSHSCKNYEMFMRANHPKLQEAKARKHLPKWPKNHSIILSTPQATTNSNSNSSVDKDVRILAQLQRGACALDNNNYASTATCCLIF